MFSLKLKCHIKVSFLFYKKLNISKVFERQTQSFSQRKLHAKNYYNMTVEIKGIINYLITFTQLII